MLSNKAEEQLAEILVQRINKVNADILEEIGKSIREIGTLNISKARQLQMMLKYGADYNKIARILAKISGKNVQDIYKIFKQIAMENKAFTKEFYDYRNVAYIPYEQDTALKRQVLAMANLTADLYKNLTNTTGIGLMVDGEFKQLQVAYSEIIDRAITSVTQGKEDFYKAMRKTLKEVGGNGLVVYESGRTRRLDSAVRMNILDGIRMVNNETNRLFGEEYGADGVEITVHENPAPDHEEVQGRQFNNDEYRRLQEEGTALTVEGDTIDISNGKGHRPISELNCYHRPMNIIVGVSQPQYTKEQLQEIRDRNNKGFEYEGKHYTMYEGTQLHRRLETAIRRNKDTQILARASGDTELAKESQIKINLLSKKYDELNKVSGLSSEKDRLTVSGYRPIKVEMPKEKVAVPKVVEEKYVTGYDAIYHLNGKSNEWWNKLDREHQKAVYRYTGGLNKDINRYLNTGELITDGLKESVEENIRNLDDALKEYNLDTDIIVYRKQEIENILNSKIDINNISNEELITKYKGEVINNKGYLSTSILPDATTSFKGDAFLELKVPKDTTGAYIGEHSSYVTEREFLLARQSKYVITDIFKEDGILKIKGKIIR